MIAQGNGLHAIAGVAEDDWVYSELDLRAIAPPLTRILNRYDVTRAAAGTGDEIALLIGVGSYVGASVQKRRTALMAIAAEAEEPVTGVAAAPDVEGPGADAPGPRIIEIERPT